MRVGLIIYGHLDIRSGGYLYDRKLVAALRDQGDEVAVLSLPLRNYGRHLLDNWDKRLLIDARAAKVDVLLQDELNHPSLVWQNARLRAALEIPIVSIVHHLRSSESHPRLPTMLYRQAEKHYVNSVDGLIYNSYTTEEAVGALLRRTKPSVIAWPAADQIEPPDQPTVAALVAQRATWPGPFRVLAVGNVTPRKNLHTVMRALARLPATEWTLIVAGDLGVDPSYANSLFDLAAELGIKSNVRFDGAVDTQTLRQLYAASHVLALPSYEGFGIVYLEAMAFGVVPIASRAGAAHEIIADGQNGYLVGLTHEEELATRLGIMLRDRSHWQKLALAARQRYDRHPTWQESMQRASNWLHEFTQDWATIR